MGSTLIPQLTRCAGDVYGHEFKPKQELNGRECLVVKVVEDNGDSTYVHVTSQICLDCTNEPKFEASRGVSVVRIVLGSGTPVGDMKGRLLTIVGDTEGSISGVYESTPDALLRQNDQEKSGYFSSVLECVHRYALWAPPQDPEHGPSSMRRVGDPMTHRFGEYILTELPEVDVQKYAGPDDFETWFNNENFWMSSGKSNAGPDNPDDNPGPDHNPVPGKPDPHVVEGREDNVHHGRGP